MVPQFDRTDLHPRNMASLVQKLATQTLKTFNMSRRNPEFHQNLTRLKDFANELTKKDLCFDERLVQSQEKFHPAYDSAPVTYIHIWEDETFTMGVFILKNGSRLPLHDHPDMHGIIRVIHGKMSVESYTVKPNVPVPPEVINNSSNPGRVLPAVLACEQILDTNSEPCLLFPEDGNLHEIRAVDGPSAFLDILSPPYDHDGGKRVCRYFEILRGQVAGASSPDSPVFLGQVSQPFDFWCTASEYLGPDPDPYTSS